MAYELLDNLSQNVRTPLPVAYPLSGVVYGNKLMAYSVTTRPVKRLMLGLRWFSFRAI